MEHPVPVGRFDLLVKWKDKYSETFPVYFLFKNWMINFVS